jgi:hypothetical protein
MRLVSQFQILSLLASAALKGSASPVGNSEQIVLNAQSVAPQFQSEEYSIQDLQLIESLKSSCGQAKPILPSSYNVSRLLEDADKIIENLRAAVRIPTEVYDVMGPVDEDPHWKIFTEFHSCKPCGLALVHA